MTLCGWRDVQIQSQTNLLAYFYQERLVLFLLPTIKGAENVDGSTIVGLVLEVQLRHRLASQELLLAGAATSIIFVGTKTSFVATNS